MFDCFLRFWKTSFAPDQHPRYNHNRIVSISPRNRDCCASIEQTMMNLLWVWQLVMFCEVEKQSLMKLHCPFLSVPLMFVHTDSNHTEDSVAAIPFVPCQWRIVKTAFLLDCLKTKLWRPAALVHFAMGIDKTCLMKCVSCLSQRFIELEPTMKSKHQWVE